MRLLISLSGKAQKYEGRCTFVTTNAILEHFGLRKLTLDECPIYGASVLNALTRQGLTYKSVLEPGQTFPMYPRTLKWCLQNLDKNKVYYLMSPNHAMALIKGHLIDTSERPGQRKVYAYEIAERV